MRKRALMQQDGVNSTVVIVLVVGIGVLLVALFAIMLYPF